MDVHSNVPHPFQTVSYDDLVVGAPMYTGIPRGKVESGRVYIFNNLQVRILVY